MDLEQGIEALDNLEGMRLHCEGVLSDLAGGGFVRRIRSAVVERELSDIRSRLGRLKLELAEACDREIEAAGVPAVSLADVMEEARTYASVAAKASKVASDCGPTGDTRKARRRLEEFASELDGYKLRTRLEFVETLKALAPHGDFEGVFKVGGLLTEWEKAGKLSEAPSALRGLAEALEQKAEQLRDTAWKFRRQIVSLEMTRPSPALVEAVGRITGARVSCERGPSM